MKSNTISALAYSGIVTLSQNIGGKKVCLQKIHNAGSNKLFSFLADCIAGDFELAKLDRPTKIMLLNVQKNVGTESEGDIINRASSFIYLLSKPERVYSASSGVASETVRLSFVIPRALLEGATFNRIGLYSDSATELDYESPAAYCEISTTESVSSMSSSSVLLIDWDLTISNK